MVSSDKVELYFALAFYKVGSIDVWAKNGREEWLNSNNIIMREVIILRNIKNIRALLCLDMIICLIVNILLIRRWMKLKIWRKY